MSLCHLFLYVIYVIYTVYGFNDAINKAEISELNKKIVILTENTFNSLVINS